MSPISQVPTEIVVPSLIQSFSPCDLGFELLPVNLSDQENEGPIQTERETSDQVFLALSVWWVAFVGLIYAMKSQQLRQWYLSCLRTTSRRTR